jgi:hypothetical protein
MRNPGFIWGPLLLGIAGLWAALLLGALPVQLLDLAGRALPAALIAVGFMLLLSRRVRFGNLLALTLTVVLVGGLAVMAFNQQSEQVRADQRKQFSQPIEAQITSVRIVLNLRNTAVDIKAAASGTASVVADFIGSSETLITSDYQVDGQTGTLTIAETASPGLPSLSALGRGQLNLTLPHEVGIQALSIALATRGGQVSVNASDTPLLELSIDAPASPVSLTGLPAALTTLRIISAGELALGKLPAALGTLNLTTSLGKIEFDASDTALKTMNAVTAKGSIDVRLTNKPGLSGDLKASDNVTVTIPPNIAAVIKLTGAAANNVAFNQNDYVQNINKELLSRRSTEPQMLLSIEAGGRVVVQ